MHDTTTDALRNAAAAIKRQAEAYDATGFEPSVLARELHALADFLTSYVGDDSNENLSCTLTISFD